MIFTCYSILHDQLNPSMPKRALIPFKFEVIFNYDTFFKVAQSFPHGPKLARLTVPPCKSEWREHPTEHRSLEGVGGLKTNGAYHSKADALVILEMHFFKFTYALFLEMLVLQNSAPFRFASATGYDTGGIRTNLI